MNYMGTWDLCDIQERKYVQTFFWFCGNHFSFVAAKDVRGS
jgi:hypothetical protein